VKPFTPYFFHLPSLLFSLNSRTHWSAPSWHSRGQSGVKPSPSRGRREHSIPSAGPSLREPVPSCLLLLALQPRASPFASPALGSIPLRWQLPATRASAQFRRPPCTSVRRHQERRHPSPLSAHEGEELVAPCLAQHTVAQAQGAATVLELSPPYVQQVAPTSSCVVLVMPSTAIVNTNAAPSVPGPSRPPLPPSSFDSRHYNPSPPWVSGKTDFSHHLFLLPRSSHSVS
jgi:hypothetical protein